MNEFQPMRASACQLIQRSDTGWIVSLSRGPVPGAGGRRPSRVQPTQTGEGGAEPRPGTVTLDEPVSPSPAVADGASCRVFFDGVLYNRAELADQFPTSSAPPINDAGLVLQAYLRWGEDVLRNVRGIFALLIWDERRDILFCARDPLGVYPLFYASAGDDLLFSTSIETLVQHPRVPDKVNRLVLAEHLCHRWTKPEETYFESVNRVLPGHAVRISAAGRQEYRYWDPVPDEARVNWTTEDELERFDELLDQAVDRCLQLGRAGVYLSGGLDSVSVAAVATDNSRRSGLADPLALSLVFPTPDTDEEAVQRRVASGLGLPHEVVSLGEAVGPEGVLGAAVEHNRGRSAPLLNPWLPAYEHLGLEGKRQGCQVIMTGGGGDEWLGVSTFYAADLVRALDFKGLYRLYNSFQRSHNLTRLALMRNLLWRFGVRPWLVGAARTVLSQAVPGTYQGVVHRRISRSIPDSLAPDPAFRQEIYRRREQNLPTAMPRSFYWDQGRLYLEHTLLAMEMEETFESGRRTGLPVLMPFYDADLVDFLYRTPPELLNQGGRTKALVRQTIGRRFPRLGFERQKKVTAYDFFNRTLREEGMRLWHKMGGAQALAELGIVDAPTLDSEMSALFAGAHPLYTWRIRDTLFLEAWLRSRT